MAVSALQVRAGEHLLVADGPASFAQALLRLLDDPSLRERLGRAGRQYVETHHNWDAIAGDLENIYRSLGAAK